MWTPLPVLVLWHEVPHVDSASGTRVVGSEVPHEDSASEMIQNIVFILSTSPISLS